MSRLARIAAIIPITLFLPSSIEAQYHFRRVFAKRYTVRIGMISRLFSPKANIPEINVEVCVMAEQFADRMICRRE
jgi:hypothetical protein